MFSLWSSHAILNISWPLFMFICVIHFNDLTCSAGVSCFLCVYTCYVNYQVLNSSSLCGCCVSKIRMWGLTPGDIYKSLGMKEIEDKSPQGGGEYKLMPCLDSEAGTASEWRAQAMIFVISWAVLFERKGLVVLLSYQENSDSLLTDPCLATVLWWSFLICSLIDWGSCSSKEFILRE